MVVYEGLRNKRKAEFPAVDKRLAVAEKQFGTRAVKAHGYFRWWSEHSVRNGITVCVLAFALAGLVRMLVAGGPLKFCDPQFHLVSVSAFRQGSRTIFFQEQWRGWLKEGLRKVRKQDPPVNKINIRMKGGDYVCLSVAYSGDFKPSQLQALSAELEDSSGKITALRDRSYALDLDGKTHISAWIERLPKTNKLSYSLRLKLPNDKPLAQIMLGEL